MSFSTGLLLGALASSLAAALVCPRAEQALAAFVVLAGSGALALGPFLAGVALARPLGQLARGLLLGIAFAAVPLAVLTSVLETSTHHRPLGAVTFAFLALLILAGAGVLCLRAVSLLEAYLPLRHRAAGLRAFALLAALGPLLLLVRGIFSPALVTGVTDAAIALGLGAVGLWFWSPKWEHVAQLAGAWVWLAVVVVGAGFALLQGAEPAALASAVLLSPFAWFLG